VSIGWLTYNMLAPLMLLWHCVFGSRGLTHMCTVMSWVSTAILAGIIVIIWLVPPPPLPLHPSLGPPSP